MKDQLELPIELAPSFDPVKDIQEFHEKFGLRYNGKPRSLSQELTDFRIGFMKEEIDEYDVTAEVLRSTLINGPRIDIPIRLEDMLDALVDLVYVALGTSYLHGFDFKEAWHRVHAANMKKIRATSAVDSKRGSSYDVVKPPGWKPPSHRDLVEDHAHQ